MSIVLISFYVFVSVFIGTVAGFFVGRRQSLRQVAHWLLDVARTYDGASKKFDTTALVEHPGVLAINRQFFKKFFRPGQR